jgi:hypothetical protein
MAKGGYDANETRVFRVCGITAGGFGVVGDAGGGQGTAGKTTNPLARSERLTISTFRLCSVAARSSVTMAKS